MKLSSLVKSSFLLALVSGLAILSAPSAFAQSEGCKESDLSIPYMGISTVRLWAGDAPEAKGTGCEDIPTLTVLKPQPGNENGSAVIVLPGGAYMGLASILEGREVADWYTARGFTAFVLRYRLGKKYLLPVPLIDARRAVRYVRAHAAEYKVVPNRIVVTGFSAGGNLAGLAGTQFVAGKTDDGDPVERVSSRPDYLVLGYPWIGGVSTDTSHLTYCKLVDILPSDPARCADFQKKFSPNLFVTKETPPTFIYHTTDDATVPVQQALSFYEAELNAGVPVEMHIFETGRHGSGLGKGDAALDQWPVLLEAWLRSHGLLTPGR